MAVFFRSYCKQCRIFEMSGEAMAECSVCGASVACNVIKNSLVASSKQLSRRCFALKTSRGSLPKAYTRSAELHIGICDENGLVHAFEDDGVVVKHWKNFLAFDIDSSVNVPWDLLSKHSKKWHRKRYRARKRNCFDFVVAFLGSQLTKAQLSHQYLCPLIAAFELTLRFPDMLNTGRRITLFLPTIRHLQSRANPHHFCDSCRTDSVAGISCRLCRSQLCRPCMELHIWARFLCAEPGC